MTSSQHGLYVQGYTLLQWVVQREAKPRGEANPQNHSQFGLQAAIRLHEAGIASNRGSATSR